MAAITAAAVNELRQATGCGLMDCKKALVENEGDFEKAVVYLREKGLASQAKKATRVAAEGMAYAAVIDGVGVIVEVNCESDFVAGGPLFNEFVSGVAKVIAKPISMLSWRVPGTPATAPWTMRRTSSSSPSVRT